MEGAVEVLVVEVHLVLEPAFHVEVAGVWEELDHLVVLVEAASALRLH